MNQLSRLSWSTASARSAGGACSSALRVFLCSSLVTLAAAAQGPRVVVSTTDDVPAAVGLSFAVQDGDLVAVQAGQPVAPFLAGGHFHAVTGFAPSDVDAYAHLPGSRPGSATGNVFSLLSNEAGFLDGDILIFTNGGGAGLLVSELDLATALGASGANIDIDGLAYDDSGRIVFSLTDNLPSSALGSVSDGDILRLEPALAGVTLLLTEADVQSAFTAATGLTDAILDVQGLEWASGEVWVTVQSPSRHDGSIIALQGTPRIVADENDLGLGGAEIDALGALRPGDEIPVFHVSAELAMPGDLVHIETFGRPGSLLFVLPAGDAGHVPFPRYTGFGAFYLSPVDPWLTAVTGLGALPRVQLDLNGRFSADWRLPTAAVYGTGPAGELGWSFQVVDLATRAISAPFRIQKL
jgi:hypothetical protein